MQRRLVGKSPQRGLLDPPEDDVNNKLSKGRERQRGRTSGVEDNTFLKNVVTFIQGPVHDFFHARTGPKGCRLVGYIRVCYALLFLYSMILMTIQLNTLLDPHKGLMSYAITGEDHYEPGAVDNRWNVFRLAPESSVVLYLLFAIGLCSGVFLLLGIQPRWAAVGTYVFLHNLRAQNNFIWDHEAHMVRLWAFFLIFLPLDHITINDGFGGLVPLIRQRLNIMRNNNNISATTTHRQQPMEISHSWPMWPFRLWQVYTCLIYLGAGLCKLNTTPWQRGFALAYCWYDEGMGRFYPSFMIELMYNRMIAIKIQTYMSLVIENLCYITIWPLKTRKWTFIAIVLLHIGIELALLMHIFEYLSVLGWVVFFAYPNDGKPADDTTVTNLDFGNDKIDKPRTSPTKILLGWTKSPEKRKKIIHSIIAGTILYLLVFDIFPRNSVERLLPTSITYLLSTFVYPSRFTKRAALKLSLASGIRSGPFLLFGGLPPHSQKRITAVVRFNDGKEPALFKYDDWSELSMIRNEIDYWYDTYLYYMLESPDETALYSAFAVHVAELYSNGGVSREYSDMMVDPNKNIVESVSVRVHTKTGRHSNFAMLSNFEPIPRGWDYRSDCKFVLDFDEVKLEKNMIHFVGMNSLWTADEDDGGDDDGDDDGVAQKDGCTNYSRADEFLHRKGGYVEAPEESDDDGSGADNNNNNNEYERRPIQGMVGQQHRARRVLPNNESGDDDGSGSDDEDDEGNYRKIVYKGPIRSGGGDDADDDDGGDRRYRRRLGAGAGAF